MRKCKECQNDIPEARLKALPSATTCVACSNTGKVAGFQMINGKTEYSSLQIVDQETYERLANLQDRKGYGISSGVKFDSDLEKEKENDKGNDNR